MARFSELTPDEADLATQAMQNIIAEMDDAPSARAVERAYWSELEAAISSGDCSIEPIQRVFGEHGATEFAKQVLKDDRYTIRISETGEVVSLPARFGIRRRGPDGELGKVYQQCLWATMPWSEFHAFVLSLTSQRDRLSTEIRAFHEIAQLEDRCPGSMSPQDACERLGIDPRSFAIDQAAS